MYPNWIGVLSALFALVAFSVAFRFGKRVEVRKRGRLLVILVALSLPGASFAAYYAHMFPEPAWYYEFRSWVGTELLVLPIGAAGGLFATWIPRRFLVAPLLLVTASVVGPFLKPFIGPIPQEMFADQWRDGICLQSTSSTCGAASAATIFKHSGIEVTEEQLASMAHSYLGGTEAWYLARGLRALGAEVRFHTTADLDQLQTPAIVGVRLGPTGHFIPIMERRGAQFVVGDPLKGRRLLTRNELMARYEFTGFFMTVTVSREAPHAAE